MTAGNTYDLRQVGELYAANRDAVLTTMAGQPMTSIAALLGGLDERQRKRAQNLAAAQTRRQVGDDAWRAFRSHMARLRVKQSRQLRKVNARAAVHFEDAVQSESAATDTTSRNR